MWPWASWIFYFSKWKPPSTEDFQIQKHQENILAKFDAVPLDIFNDLFIQLFEIHKNVLQSKEFSLKKNKTLFYCMCICSYGINPQLWPHALRMASWNSYRMTQRMFVEVCKYINILTKWFCVVLLPRIQKSNQLKELRLTRNNGFNEKFNTNFNTDLTKVLLCNEMCYKSSSVT